MATTYSTFDAKSKFSEVIRRVRDGESVIVSFQGDPIAEVKPVARTKKTSMEERHEELVRRGVVIPARNPNAPIRPEAYRPGGLKRFLEDRNR